MSSPTEVINAVIALLVVQFDCLGVGATDAVADGVAAHHNVLVLWGGPAHHNAVDQRPHMQRAGDVRHLGLWCWEAYMNERKRKITKNKQSKKQTAADLLIRASLSKGCVLLLDSVDPTA